MGHLTYSEAETRQLSLTYPRHVMSGLFFHSMFYIFLFSVRNQALLQKHVVSSLITILHIPMKKNQLFLKVMLPKQNNLFMFATQRGTNEIISGVVFLVSRGATVLMGPSVKNIREVVISVASPHISANNLALPLLFLEYFLILFFCFLNSNSFSSTLTLHAKC